MRTVSRVIPVCIAHPRDVKTSLTIIGFGEAVAEDLAHIVIVSPNAAFSAFAESVLTSWPDVQVHSVETSRALLDLRFHPSVIACNFEFDNGFYDAFAPLVSGFRSKGPVATLAIVRHLDGWTRTRCSRSGIDEIVVKPISPLHLGLRLAALATGHAWLPPRHSAEILKFPTRHRAYVAPGLQPFAP
jgi:DNA-binding NarL/FixJ family response regulator